MTSPERPCAVPIQKEDHQKAFSSRGGSSTPLSFFLEDVQNIPVLPSETRMAYFQQRDICRHQVQLLEAIGEKRTDEQNSLLEQLQKEIQEKEKEEVYQMISFRKDFLDYKKQ